MTSTIVCGTSTPTLNLSVKTAIDYNHKRSAMNSKNFGGKEGPGKARSSGRTIGTLQFSFILTTDTVSSAVVKLGPFAIYVRDDQKETVTVTLDLGDDDLIFTGIITDIDDTGVAGEVVTKIPVTMSMDIISEIWPI
jgi:hypothetical protein